MCVCIAVFESILRVKSGDSSIWWVPLNILSFFYNKIYKTENTESSIILNKIRSLLGGSSEHSFREHRPCYIHGRTHVGISDVAKCGKGILAHKPKNIILFTVTSTTNDIFVTFGVKSALRSLQWSTAIAQKLPQTYRISYVRKCLFHAKFHFTCDVADASYICIEDCKLRPHFVWKQATLWWTPYTVTVAVNFRLTASSEQIKTFCIDR